MKQRNRAYLLCALTLSAASAQAANLIQNPDFDSALTGWNAVATGAQIDNTDGSPTAPAGQFSTNPDTLFVTAQCVSLAGSPPPWEFGMRLRTVSSTGNSCRIQVYTAFDNGSCAMPGTNFSAGAPAGNTVPGTQGTFTQYAGTTNDPMPGGSPSQVATLSLQVSCNPGDSITLNVDHAYLGTVGTTPVRLQSFEVQ